MKYMYKMIFLFTLFMGTMISVSSMSWMGTWMGLEINLLSFIPLLKKNNNSFSSESSIKYFLIQAIASSIFLFTVIMIMMTNNMMTEMFFLNKFMLMIMNSSLLMKMGAAPFHFWFPEVIEGMNWTNSMILMTWQKIAPMMLISYSLKSSQFIIIVIIMCTMIGSIGGLNQTSLRKIMAFSSINHIGWMISSFLINEMIWLIYFIIYSFMLMILCNLMNMYKIYYLIQMYNLMNNNSLIKFNLMLNFMSLGGLPPFLGFMPKWMIIQSLSINYMYLLFFMIMMSLITLFFYLRISYNSLILIHNELNFNKIMYFNLNNKYIMIYSFISLSGMTLITLMFNFI